MTEYCSKPTLHKANCTKSTLHKRVELRAVAEATSKANDIIARVKSSA